MSTLRWKLALFLLLLIPCSFVDGVIADIQTGQHRYKSIFTYIKSSIYDCWTSDTPEDRSLFVLILAVICWLPFAPLSYFLLSTYYTHFPESLI